MCGGAPQCRRSRGQLSCERLGARPWCVSLLFGGRATVQRRQSAPMLGSCEQRRSLWLLGRHKARQRERVPGGALGAVREQQAGERRLCKGHVKDPFQTRTQDAQLQLVAGLRGIQSVPACASVCDQALCRRPGGRQTVHTVPVQAVCKCCHSRGHAQHKGVQTPRTPAPCHDR